MFLESSELYRVDIHMYLYRHAWHCCTSEPRMVNLGVSGINRPRERCVVKTEQEGETLYIFAWLWKGGSVCSQNDLTWKHAQLQWSFFTHLKWQRTVLLVCCLGHHTSQCCNLREAEPAGVVWLLFCKSHNSVDGNLLLNSPVTTRKACASAEEMFPSYSSSATGGTDASHPSLANRWIIFLLASTHSFRTGFHRNTHCWTEKTADWQGSLLPKSSPGANGGNCRDGDKMTTDSPYLLLNISIAKWKKMKSWSIPWYRSTCDI